MHDLDRTGGRVVCEPHGREGDGCRGGVDRRILGVFALTRALVGGGRGCGIRPVLARRALDRGLGPEADVRQERIRKYAELFELTGDLGQPIAAYSHGMKQKLAIISAWIHEPKLILMDEPFVGLDPKASHLLKGMMRELCDRGGAIFFSTHVLEVAEKLCDKVAIIKGGKLIRSGTMEEVKGDDSLEEVFLELEGEQC